MGPRDCDIFPLPRFASRSPLCVSPRTSGRPVSEDSAGQLVSPSVVCEQQSVRGYEDAAAVGLASYRSDLGSPPNSVHGCLMVQSLVSRDSFVALEEYQERMLRALIGVREHRPLLRYNRKWSSTHHRGSQLGVVNPASDRRVCREERRWPRQCLIVDARRENRQFRASPPVCPCTPQLASSRWSPQVP